MCWRSIEWSFSLSRWFGTHASLRKLVFLPRKPSGESLTLNQWKKRGIHLRCAKVQDLWALLFVIFGISCVLPSSVQEMMQVGEGLL